MTTQQEVWHRWTDQYVTQTAPVPLFQTGADDQVQYKEYGQNDRRILKRSAEMEDLLRTEGRKVIEDWETTDDTYQGLIYLMYWMDGDTVRPLYVGIAGKYGNDGESLSTNLKGLRGSTTRKFARWGDAYAYHIGDLSAVVFNHDKNQKEKYERWADRLFAGERRLRSETYFWTKAWARDDEGTDGEVGIALDELEDQLIDIAADLYPDDLLNTVGA